MGEIYLIILVTNNSYLPINCRSRDVYKIQGLVFYSLHLMNLLSNFNIDNAMIGNKFDTEHQC